MRQKCVDKHLTTFFFWKIRVLVHYNKERRFKLILAKNINYYSYDLTRQERCSIKREEILQSKSLTKIIRKETSFTTHPFNPHVQHHPASRPFIASNRWGKASDFVIFIFFWIFHTTTTSRKSFSSSSKVTFSSFVLSIFFSEKSHKSNKSCKSLGKSVVM